LNKILRNVIAAILMLCLIYTSVPTAFSAATEPAQTAASTHTAATAAPKVPTEYEFAMKLKELRQKYPHGEVWEGVYYEDGIPKAWTCHAYAVQLFCEIFGVEFYNGGYYTDCIDYDFDTISAGDIVRIDYDSHSIFITEVTKDKIYYTDANSTGYNQIRWDGWYTVDDLRSRFDSKIHFKGNNLIGKAMPQHTIAYNSGGGEGKVEPVNIEFGSTLKIRKNTFTRKGYTFAGYSVYRVSDKKWFTRGGHGWQTRTAINDKGYRPALYTEGSKYSFGSSWIAYSADPTTFIFYAQWLPDKSAVEYYPNYSGYNYLLGANLGDDFSNYIVSDDSQAYDLAVDTSQRLNNMDSLRIIARKAGSYSLGFSIATSTNHGHNTNSCFAENCGDSKDMVLRFYAKSTAKGSMMSIRWNNSSTGTAKVVTLNHEWTAYSVAVPKNINMDTDLRIYCDRVGIYYINAMVLTDGTETTNIYPEPCHMYGRTVYFDRGKKMGALPTPTRKGYTFAGWYTAAVGGTRVTADTVLKVTSLRLYARWSKVKSTKPVSTAKLSTHTYELYDTPMSWEAADKFCRAKGGHLITIANVYENNVAAQLIEGRKGFCWLGLRYQTSNRKWLWTTGHKVTYQKWDDEAEPGATTQDLYAVMYPFNYGGTHIYTSWTSCAAISNPVSFYSWHNSMFICEYDGTPSAAAPTEAPTQPPTGYTARYICGDVDGDNEVTIIDATYIQMYLAELTQLSSDSLLRADIDSANGVTIHDATRIQNWLASYKSKYTVGQYIYVFGSPTEAPADPPTQDMTAAPTDPPVSDPTADPTSATQSGTGSTDPTSETSTPTEETMPPSESTTSVANEG